MRITLLQWALSACAFIATAYVVPGFKVSGFFSALIAAFVIGFVSIFVKPVLLFLTLPITILTLGLFIFVINGIVIKICAALVPGFEVDSWLGAIFGAIVLTLFNSLFYWFAGI